MATQTEAIAAFLKLKTHHDLYMLYNQNMEVQVNVGAMGGERYEGTYNNKKWFGWTDGDAIWKSFRIPVNANTPSPIFDFSRKMSFDLLKYTEGIGMTGWDFVNKTSKWVAFDFDAVSGHSEQHSKKLSDQDLDNVRDILTKIDWVTLRRSTSGKGLHMYVFLPDVPTETHTEHAALARSILGIIMAETGFDFQSKVDVCGGNMWVWHKKMLNTPGLEIIKQGSVFTKLPNNWREHIPVITGKAVKITPAFVNDDLISNFTQLTGQRTRITLDESHKQLMKWLNENNCKSWWDADNNMLVAHTYNLKEAHKALNFVGIFETISKGTESGSDHNCFMYPLKNGGWVIRRFSQGVAEASTWSQDSSGWTRCYYNVNPNLQIAAAACGGIEDAKGNFIFNNTKSAVEAAQMIGVTLQLPVYMNNREVKFKLTQDGRLSIEVEKESKDVAADMEGWLNNKDKFWSRIISIRKQQPYEPEIGNYDDQIRHLVTCSDENFGWVLNSDGMWRYEPLKHVETYLASLGARPKDIAGIVGSGVHKPWVIVNLPFKPEYPGNRQWNRNTAQLKFAPVAQDDLSFPTWNKILTHCGSSLDEAVKEDTWCKTSGILTGADYLTHWIASVIQSPHEPLPYLFFFGPQNSGKSIFHEAISTLITNGIENAGLALDNQGGFNAEIENAVICFVEEKNFNRNRIAYNRIKEWVTAQKIVVHRKGQTPYTVKNSTHWIQCANHREYCPIFPGDERITVVYVPEIPADNLIAKRDLLQLLIKEGPEFTTHLLRLELHKAKDRLAIPVITTRDKQDAIVANTDPLEEFIKQKCFNVPGKVVMYSVFYESFIRFCQEDLALDEQDLRSWTKIKVGKQLPRWAVKGRSTQHGSQFVVGNLSFKAKDPNEPEQKELLLNGEFVR